ncbi:hypothetical protein BY996DRAFT_6544493 [Phakopsora pachyrhizi]|nr:hypothetical protein BY996DRAFT_6544493 [Phakopsora pachyrhizi]
MALGAALTSSSVDKGSLGHEVLGTLFLCSLSFKKPPIPPNPPTPPAPPNRPPPLRLKPLAPPKPPAPPIPPIPPIPPNGRTGGGIPPTGGKTPPTGGKIPPTGGKTPPTGGQDPANWWQDSTDRRTRKAADWATIKTKQRYTAHLESRAGYTSNGPGRELCYWVTARIEQKDVGFSPEVVAVDNVQSAVETSKPYIVHDLVSPMVSRMRREERDEVGAKVEKQSMPTI